MDGRHAPVRVRDGAHSGRRRLPGGGGGRTQGRGGVSAEVGRRDCKRDEAHGGSEDQTFVERVIAIR